MVWNEQLKINIPTDWTAINIRNITSITWGQCPNGVNILPLSSQGNGILDYCSGAGDMKGGFLVDCQARTNDSRRLAFKDDILVSIAGKIGDMCVVDHQISLGRAAMAYSAKNKDESPFIYMVLHNLNKKMTTISSGSIQKVINSDNIDEFNFAYNQSVVKKYTEIALPIYRNLINNSKESRDLIELRNWLLPMLMNGQATVIE